MRKFEISLAPNYVPSWTVVDGVREIFQNALDEERRNEDNPLFFGYDEEKERLVIGNKQSGLSTQSLLLGVTTKADDDTMLGQFGEGYKIATLVLLRNNKKVTIFNRRYNELWEPRFVDSRRYNTKVLTFFVKSDNKRWAKESEGNDLVFHIGGITADEWEQIKRSNLHMQVYEKMRTPRGEVLTGERHSGQVFVDGLYVCKHSAYEYGYNFKPEYVDLDRDRKLVSDFDLKWIASKLWSSNTHPGTGEIIARLAEKGKADVEYLTSAYTHRNRLNDISQYVFNDFKQRYGDKAVPVTTQVEAEQLASGHQPIIVTESYKRLVESSPDYEFPESEETPTFSSRLREWYQTYDHELSTEAADLLYKLLVDMEEQDI